MKKLVIIPAFNESETIAQVIRGIQEENLGIDIIVVNDGSTDHTSVVASDAGVKVISMPFNMGVGAAMRAGFLYAHENNYDAAIQFDGDGQHFPADISTILDGLANSNIVIGNRFHHKGAYSISNSRLIAIKTLSFIVSKLISTKISDPTSGCRSADKSAINFFSKNYPNEYLNDTIASAVLAHKSGLSISEKPVTMQVRQGGKPSQSHIRAIFHLMRTTIVIFIIAIRRPIPFEPDLRKK